MRLMIELMSIKMWQSAEKHLVTLFNKQNGATSVVFILFYINE